MPLEPHVIVLGLLAVFVGTCLQRVAGMGVGLIVGPALAVLIGPQEGILATNAITIGSAGILTMVRWREIQWRRVAWIVPAALPGAVAGAWLVGQITPALLQVVIGAMVLVAMLLTLTLPELRHSDGRPQLVVAGAVGGMLNSAVGIAAPAMVIHARRAHWRQPGFGASMQPVFFSMGLFSVVSKLSLHAITPRHALPHWWYLLLAWAVVGIGAVVAAPVAKRVAPSTAQWLAAVIAAVGALVVVVRGVIGLW